MAKSTKKSTQTNSGAIILMVAQVATATLTLILATLHIASVSAVAISSGQISATISENAIRNLSGSEFDFISYYLSTIQQAAQVVGIVSVILLFVGLKVLSSRPNIRTWSAILGSVVVTALIVSIAAERIVSDLIVRSL